MLLIVPSVLAALARYLSFRLRYDETEMVIRSGIVFRNERHVPYHRIQNLDAVQNVVHRLLGVMEVRVDTGASKEPEATISVIPEAAFTDMRRRVFAGRSPTPAAEAATEVAAPPEGRTLLQLPLRELLLSGFLENRGLVVVAAFYGLLWESGLFGPLWDRLFAEGSYTPGMVRGVMRSIAAGEPLPLGPLAVIVSGIVLLLLLVRALSMLLAVTRLYGFRLSRVGDDLRSEFGLLTRVSATIPVRRVQSLTVRSAPLYRLFSRMTLRVETAGGSSPQDGQRPATRQREMLAPIVQAREAPALVREVLPEVDLSALEWRPPHPRAFRRAVKPAVFFALLISLGAMAVIHWRAVFASPLIVLWMIVVTHKSIRCLGWAVNDDLVALRKGWLWRTITVIPLGRIQAVGRFESPFDRRTAMARVRVDTAGANERSHRVDIPYLPVETANELHRRLAAAAATSAFRW
jgi:putative membrane protein